MQLLSKIRSVQMPQLPACVWLIDITWYLNICRNKQNESFILEAEENREKKQIKTLFITLMQAYS